jgi:hypothetical protein
VDGEDERAAELLAALADSRPMRTVEVTTPESGMEVLFYDEDPGHAYQGTLTIPPELLPPA